MHVRTHVLGWWKTQMMLKQQTNAPAETLGLEMVSKYRLQTVTG
jgi:hypothetical protein